MDKRENQEENAYEKELKEVQERQYSSDWITINGKQYRVPYRMVKEVTFAEVSKSELIDLEHAARLQYRLMLMEPILRAKVEYAKQRITIVYNPTDADNRKPKISLEELMDTLSKEGVRLYNNPREVHDFDYFKEMYSYHFDPPAIREHPPYGYTAKEWEKMKDEYYRKTGEAREKNWAKFREWQNSYAMEHAEALGIKPEEIKLKPATLKEKILGRKKSKKGEKGFWFHGV